MSIKIKQQLPTGYGSVIKEPEWLEGYEDSESPQFYRMNISGEWECLDGAGTLTARGLASLIYRNKWEPSTMTEFDTLLVEHPDWYPSVEPFVREGAQREVASRYTIEAREAAQNLKEKAQRNLERLHRD